MSRRVVCCLFLVAFVAAAENPVVEPTLRDVPYGPLAMQTLNFWKAESDRPTPVLVDIHGGGWVGGAARAEMHKYPFLAQGISMVSISYRLAPADPLPAPVLDAALAVQFVRSKAAEWGLDKERLAVMGTSAGGCTSVWLALHDDLADPDNPDPVRRESTKPVCALGNAAQTFVDVKMVQEAVGEPAARHRMIWATVGAKSLQDALDNYDTYAPLYREYSAYYHVDANDPPVLLYYKSAGPDIHGAAFGLKLQERAREVGATVYVMAPNHKLAADYPHDGRWTFISDRLLAPPEQGP